MHDFTSVHNRLADYEPYFLRWTDEEMANIGYTMCCQIDVMMNGYLATLEDRFRKEGGMKERMHRVRTGYRAEQDRKMLEMEATIKWQEARIKELEDELERVKRIEEDGRGRKRMKRIEEDARGRKRMEED
jgi:four helix bundle suffix protein